MRVHPRLVSVEYFQTMGIPLVRGREFTAHDADGSGNVVVVNETAARRYWLNEDRIGQRISIGAEADWREIVGVVGDTRHEGLDADADPAAYLPQRQRFESLGAGFERAATLVILTSGDAASGRTDRFGPPSRMSICSTIGLVRQMDDLIGESVAPRRLNFVLVCASPSRWCSPPGLYGVMSYW